MKKSVVSLSFNIFKTAPREPTIWHNGDPRSQLVAVIQDGDLAKGKL